MLEKRIRIFTGGAPLHVLEQLVPAFERETGCAVDMVVKIVADIQKQVLSGDHPDVILLPQRLIDDIEETVETCVDGRAALARVGIGLVTKSGRALTDFTDLSGLKKLLLEARHVVVADPRTPTGRHLAFVFEKLGITKQLSDKLIHKGAIHGGGTLVATGEADFGLFLVSEVQHLEGLQLAGFLPTSVQNYIVYCSSVPTSSNNTKEAIQFVQFLKSPFHHNLWRVNGFEPEA